MEQVFGFKAEFYVELDVQVIPAARCERETTSKGDKGLVSSVCAEHLPVINQRNFLSISCVPRVIPVLLQHSLALLLRRGKIYC